MADGNAVPQGAPAPGGPGPAGTPGQPPAQTGGAAAPPPGGGADTTAPAVQPAGPPEGSVQPAPPAPSAPDPWAEAAKWRKEAESQGKRADYREGDRARLREVEATLKQKYGDNYLDEIERRITAPRQPVQPPPPAAAPVQVMPSLATARGLPPDQLSAWLGQTFWNLYRGHKVQAIEQRQDPNAGVEVPVQVEKDVPPDPAAARQLAETFQRIFDERGIRAPWDGYVFVNPPEQAPRAAPDTTPPNALTEEALDQREATREVWEDSFYAEVEKAGKEEFGPEWFDEEVILEINGKPRQMTRERALFVLCKPSREYPNGMPLHAGLLAHMAADSMSRKSAVAFNAGLSRTGSVGGGVPGVATAGPPLDPSARRQRADELAAAGITGGNWAAEPPPDAAPVIRVYGAGGRSAGLPV